MAIQSISSISQPFKYIYGLGLSNNVDNPDEIIDIAIGQCRDSNDSLDIVVNSVLTVNNKLSGAGGIDTGVVQGTKIYSIYVISDSSNKLIVSTLMVLASSSLIVIPPGYDSYRKIGYGVTNSSSDFLLFYQYGLSNERQFRYDSGRTTDVTGGNSTSYAPVTVTNFVPPEENIPVFVAYTFIPGAGGRVLNMTPGNATGNSVSITGQVGGGFVTGNELVMARITSSVTEFDYKVSSSGDLVGFRIAGFLFSV